jgi:hypothetical protein
MFSFIFSHTNLGQHVNRRKVVFENSTVPLAFMFNLVPLRRRSSRVVISRVFDLRLAYVQPLLMEHHETLVISFDSNLHR